MHDLSSESTSSVDDDILQQHERSYPHALHHLELLQNAQFRSEIGKDEWREYLNQKQFDHWRTW